MIPTTRYNWIWIKFGVDRIELSFYQIGPNYSVETCQWVDHDMTRSWVASVYPTTEGCGRDLLEYFLRPRVKLVNYLEKSNILVGFNQKIMFSLSGWQFTV